MQQSCSGLRPIRGNHAGWTLGGIVRVVENGKKQKPKSEATDE